MKKVTGILACIFLLCLSLSASAQLSKKTILENNREFRENLNREFRDSVESPLTPGDRLLFKELEFYPVKTKYCVVAVLKRTPEAQPFEMQRSKGNTGTYRKYGEASFTLDGKKYSVCVYQYLKLLSDEKYANHLFLPFADLTNGTTTYGSGRFIDLTIPAGDTLIIDFNQAYNPYCAYNSKYSCPIPPRENQLPVKIPAGIKTYGNHHE
jgi:uncharacterized protein (DUF1684 family)